VTQQHIIKQDCTGEPLLVQLYWCRALATPLECRRFVKRLQRLNRRYVYHYGKQNDLCDEGREGWDAFFFGFPRPHKARSEAGLGWQAANKASRQEFFYPDPPEGWEYYKLPHHAGLSVRLK
jgi:hypothetical protein